MFRMFALTLLPVAVLGVWLNNTSFFVSQSGLKSETRLIAHRGVHQIYAGSVRTNDTCRARSVKPIEHAYIENTLPSIRAAFDFGADVVEIDAQLTADNVLVVFHDWTLDCQTNGNGVTHMQRVSYLRKLDVGHWFTSDGKSYPLRGSGNPIPDLQSVFNTDLKGRLLINFKSNFEVDGQRLAELMSAEDVAERVFGVYGGANPTRSATKRVQSLKGFDKPALKACIVSYMLIGWSGIVPAACENRIIAVPINFAPLLWGWPYKFSSRMKAAGTNVILWGPYDWSGFSNGIDDVETLAQVPDGFDGYLWTNRIELIGPLVRNSQRF